MSKFVQLIPSDYSYFSRFEQLDETDLRIITRMVEKGAKGPRNVRSVAKDLGLPQQTVNYRMLRIDSSDLVRFRAIANETLLGLTSYCAFVTVRPGLLYENEKGDAVNSGTFLTCYPVWRSMKEIQGGESHGFYLRYSIPPGKRTDLELFMERMKEVGCIARIDEFCEITQTRFNKPSIDLYLDMMRTIKEHRPLSFKWETWVDDFSEAEKVLLPGEGISKKSVSFSYEHLRVLSCLEQDLRAKTSEIARSVGETNSKIVKWLKETEGNHLISDCEAEIFAVNPRSALHLVLRIDFSDENALRRFVGHLNAIPFSASYQKATQQDAIFLHIAIPPYEFFNFRNTLDSLSRAHGIIRNYRIYFSNYVARWDNTQLYETFSRSEEKWEFSFGRINDAFERLLKDHKSQF